MRNRGTHTAVLESAKYFVKWLKKNGYEHSLGEISTFRNRRPGAPRVLKVKMINPQQYLVEIVGNRSKQRITVLAGRGFWRQLDEEQRTLGKWYLLKKFDTK